VQLSEKDDADQDEVQPNIRFAILKEQSLFYGGIPDYDAIDYPDVEVGQESPKELAASIEDFATSAEQAGMSQDGVQILRQLIT
jgi:hypothetical protein